MLIIYIMLNYRRVHRTSLPVVSLHKTVPASYSFLLIASVSSS